VNRRHFIRLHKQGVHQAGIIACTVDADYVGQAGRILAEVNPFNSLLGRVIRINRPG